MSATGRLPKELTTVIMLHDIAQIEMDPNIQSVMKDFVGDDPRFDKRIRYANEHSDKRNEVWQKLIDVTLKHSKYLMMGAPEVIRLNMNIMRAIGARKVLDVGVYTGCSSLGAALAIPDDGKVIGCDVSEEFVNIGRPYWKEAGVADKIDVRIQPALKTLDELIADGQAGTFDFAFIDADKENYHSYYERCLVLLRPMGVISVDNVIYSGRVLQPDEEVNESTRAIKDFNNKIRDDQRVFKTMHNIGDGLTLIFKK